MPRLPTPKNPLQSKRNLLVLEGHKKGISTLKLAKRFNVSRMRIYHILHEYGIRHTPYKSKLTPQQERWAVHHYLNSNRTVEEIAAKYNVTTSAIKRLARRHNIPRRGARGKKPNVYSPLSNTGGE